MGIGPRIKQERERLGLSQTAFADAIQSTKRSVINWEGGAAVAPSDAVARMAAAGADVLYILTGERSQAVAEVELLPSDERVLVDAYRRCNAEAKRNLIQTAALLSAGMQGQSAPSPSGGVTQTISAPVGGHVAAGNVSVVGAAPRGGSRRAKP